MKSSLLLLAALLAVAAPGWAQTKTGAIPAEGFQPLAEITEEDEPWSGVLAPEAGPARDGGPTVALRWPVAERPGPDSPPLLDGWAGVDALRFWLHTDQAYPFTLAVLLTGPMNGYFMTSIPLDFQGWRQFALPIAQFRPVREADLSKARSLAFRAQGYGQPPLEKGMTWWVDGIEARPKADARLPRLAGSIETNRADWEALARQGNPYLLLNARRYASDLAPFRAPERITSAWQYRGVAEDLVPLAYAAADPQSPRRGRKDLVAHALALVDWLVGECSAEGWWWHPGSPQGDPNINRFTLGPLLDGVRWLRMLPEGEAAWPRWRERLATAVELQRRAYRNEVPWDWGGTAGGEYANQDAYYVLILRLSSELFGRPADRGLAEEMMRKIAANLLPDGGISYIGVENEAPVYHGLNLIVLGRYATLSGDPVARKLLRDTAPYWPLVLTAEGQPEYWSDVWWKQTWGYVWREALVVAAGATGEARNQGLMWRALERVAPTDAGMAGIYCAPYWTGTAPGQPLPERFLLADRNMRGLRGREGPWYFGVTQGRGLRNTFVGGLMTRPQGAHPLRAAFRGAQIHVLEDAKRPFTRWLSEMNDRTALALRPGKAGALAARYTLQPSLINGVPTPVTTPSPWQVTQLWRAAGDGVLGMVALEATADAPAKAVAGRLALGPQPVKQVSADTWACGPLRVKLFQQFGTVSAQPVPGYNQTREQAWPGLEMLLPLPSGVKRGDRFVYAAWVGPETATPPASLGLLPGDRGWVARWADGRLVELLYNTGAQPVAPRLPQGFADLPAWIGEAGSPRARAARMRLEAGACALVER